MNSGNFCELTIENFLLIKHFQAKITPIVALYGDNGSGKSILAKLLYIMQKNSSRSSLAQFIWTHKWRRSRSRLASKDNFSLSEKEAFISGSLYDGFIEHAGKRKGLSISGDFENYILTSLQRVIRQQFSRIPRYFGQQGWKKLIGNNRKQQECIFSSTNSRFQGKVIIKTTGTEEKILIEPKLRLHDSQTICLSILLDHNLGQMDEEMAPSSVLSEFWDDPIFTIKSILLSIQQKDKKLFEELDISIPILVYRRRIYSSFKDCGLEWQEYREDDLPETSYERWLKDFRRNIEKHKMKKDLEESIKIHLLEEFIVRILRVLAQQLPFNPFSESGESLFFPPGKMQIILDFEKILRDAMEREDVEDYVPVGIGLNRNMSYRTRYYNEVPEIQEFVTFILDTAESSNSKIIGEDGEKINLLKKLRKMQRNVYFNSVDEGKLIFYNERTEKEAKVYEVPSSILSLMPFDLLLRRIGLDSKSVSIVFEELENHLHPSNIEKICKLIAELCLMNQEDGEKDKKLKANTNMVITTHSFHVLFFLLFAVGLEINPTKIKDYYTAIHFELLENQEYTECKVIDIDEEGYLIDPYVDEDIHINRDMQEWMRRWKGHTEGESERDK